MYSDIICPVCANASALPVLAKYGFTYGRCTACQAVFVTPMPSAEALRAHYQNPAYFDGEGDQGYRNYADMRKALMPHSQRRLRILGKRLERRGRLLDFGCAAGYFLDLARSDGWQISGIELSREMAQEASQVLGVPVASALEDLPHEDRFDVITLWEVIEHVPEPVVVLGQLRDRLRPGGALMLSTPNAAHWQAVREPETWPGYRPPSHLVLFTPASLHRVLGQAGFEHIQVSRVAPLPPLPGWLRRATVALERDLGTGQARPWGVALATWRVIRLVGWGWHRLVRRTGDIFATLEALAFRPL